MEDVLRFSVTNDQSALTSLSAQVEQAVEERQLTPKVAFAVQLTIDEIISNIIKHGASPQGDCHIGVCLTFGSEQITIEIDHEGEPFNPFAFEQPILDRPMDERPIGGLGLHLTRSVMDGESEYAYRAGRNMMVLRKKLGSTAGRKTPNLP